MNNGILLENQHFQNFNFKSVSFKYRYKYLLFKYL